MSYRLTFLLAMGAMIFAAKVSAQTVQVTGNGTLTQSTSTSTIFNDVDLGAVTSGFNFSGATGSFALPTAGGAFSSPVSASNDGYYYADYLITVNSSTAESVTTTLEDPAGVGNLSERIYTYNNAVGINGFLGDASLASTGVTGVEVWSTNYPLPGAEVSIVSPTDLTAGSYVVELRGSTIGNFAGTLSISPVLEPETYGMLLAGLVVICLLACRRKHNIAGSDRVDIYST